MWFFIRDFWRSTVPMISAFSSGTLKLLQDPNSKSNGKSDCFNILHPRSLPAFTIIYFHLKWWIRNWPADYYSVRLNTKIDLVMSLHIRILITIHFHSWNLYHHWQHLKRNRFWANLYDFLIKHTFETDDPGFQALE